MKKNTDKAQTDTQASTSLPMNDTFAQFLQMLPENKEFTFQFLDLFP